MTFSLLNMPTSYVLTLHKQRLDAFYTKHGTTFKDELTLAKLGIGSCVHMSNLVVTYGADTIEQHLFTFYTQEVG